jgi:hypothetical protein
MDKLQQIKEALQLATQFKSRGDANVITLDAWYALHDAKPLIDEFMDEDKASWDMLDDVGNEIQQIICDKLIDEGVLDLCLNGELLSGILTRAAIKTIKERL